MEWQIFVLGTNNWQGGGEFAPGSGILHESHHAALNVLPNVNGRCYSIWPSSKQKSPKDRKDYRIFELPHDIPICESVSPVSNKRWHSMDEAEFNAYRNRLITECEAYIEEVEKENGRPFNLFMAHHTFVNPTVMVEINDRRIARGLKSVPVVVFAHGTALKMYENELNKLEEYPSRFLPWMREKVKVFESGEKVAGVFAIANAQKDTFQRIFPNFPPARVAVTPNGYNQHIFAPTPGATKENVLTDALPQILYEGFDSAAFDAEVIKALSDPKTGKIAGVPNPSQFQKIVLFTGRFADWKRLDAVLKAAKQYEDKHPEIATIIIGGGTNDARKHYVDIAYQQLKLKRTFFLGPQPQNILSSLYTIADIGCFPSHDEPFGLVFIECMACGTPVIGAKSGGPLDFVKPEVGTLIDEGTLDEVSVRAHDAILQALAEDWKKTKGPTALDYALKNFSLGAQCARMLDFVEHHFLSTSSL